MRPPARVSDTRPESSAHRDKRVWKAKMLRTVRAGYDPVSTKGSAVVASSQSPGAQAEGSALFVATQQVKVKKRKKARATPLSAYRLSHFPPFSVVSLPFSLLQSPSLT